MFAAPHAYALSLMVMTPKWGELRNVLAIRLDSLGDVLMTTPALRALKENNPHSRLTLMTSTAGAAVAPLIPEIDAVIPYAAPWMKTAAGETDPSMVHRLQAENFDAAVIFTVFTQSALPAALLCLWAGIPRRLAYARENPYALLTTWVPERDSVQACRHEVRRQLDLVAAVGYRPESERLSLQVSTPVQMRMRQLLEKLGIVGERLWVVVHPGASAPSRRYPAGHFARVVQHIVTHLHAQVILTGDRGELPLIRSIQRDSGVATHSLAGILTVEELAALIGQAPVLISNNTGPAHVAAAMGTPIVELYALTNPQHTPWQVPHRALSYDVPCRNCFKSICPQGHHHCLSEVTPAAVVDAVHDFLSRRSLCTP